MADSRKGRRNGFVTWEPGRGEPGGADGVAGASARDGSPGAPAGGESGGPSRDPALGDLDPAGGGSPGNGPRDPRGPAEGSRGRDGDAAGGGRAGVGGGARRRDGTRGDRRRQRDGGAGRATGRRGESVTGTRDPEGADRQRSDPDDRGYPGDRETGDGRAGGATSGAGRTSAAGGDGRGGAAARGLGVGLLDAPLDGRAGDGLPEEPGRTMVGTHLSSAPPELGPVRTSLDENKAILDAIMGVGKSFDIIYRELRFGDTRLAIYVVNGMYESITNLVLINMTEWLTDLSARRHELPQADRGAGALHALFQARLAYAQVTKTKSLNEVAFEVMSGPVAILVDGADEAIVVDTRDYPDRQPDEPTTERVIRGPHDGFVETLVFNTTLIRRRIRDPRLHFAIAQAGVRTQMDVAIGYVEGLTDPALVDEVTRRIKAIGIDEVTMAERTVAEYLSRESWNPFPTTRMTERPDVAAFHLMEGHVVVLVDTSPQAIICPATLWNHLQHPEDFHLSPIMGTYMRWVQFIGLAFATLVPPLWLAYALDPRLVHALPSLAFIGPKKTSGFPLGLQFLGAEVTIDLLRRAILNTPGNLSATMGILGAIVLGDVAAKTGIFSSEVLVYLVLAAIGQFAVSNLELGMAARMVRLTLLIGVWALRLPGLLIGTLIWLLVLLSTRTFGIPYTWPLIPFNWAAFRGMLFREPAHVRSPRPLVLRVQNRARQ